MNNQQILERAIAKAIAGGYDDKKENLESVYKLIIFNHDFAKALWGDKKHNNHCVQCRRPNWEFHLQNMVIADDPIKYLEQNI